MLDYPRQRTYIVALLRLLPSFTPTGLCFDSLDDRYMRGPCCALSIRSFSIENISLLGFTLTRLPSDMSCFLHVLKTRQAGTHSESLSYLILGRILLSMVMPSWMPSLGSAYFVTSGEQSPSSASSFDEFIITFASFFS